MRKRAACPAPLGSIRIQASGAAGIDDPASTSQRHLVDAGDCPSTAYVLVSMTLDRQATIDSTTEGPTPIAKSYKVIFF